MLSGGGPCRGTRMVLFAAPGSGAMAAVAGRRIGGAVERNRARRILRSAWSEAAPRVLEGTDIVLVARPEIGGAKAQDLVAEIIELARRAGVSRA